MKKTLPILVLSIFIFSCGFYFFSKNPAAYSQRALEHFIRGELSAAEKTLEALEQNYPSYPTALYWGYLAQVNGRYREAERQFQVLLSYTRESSPFHEVHLGQALNAYFEGNDALTASLITSAKDCAPLDFDFTFYDGLIHYLSHRYEEAFELWNKWATAPCLPSAHVSWHDTILHSLFTNDWVQVHLAHCLLEEGDLSAAQQILEQEFQLLAQKEKCQDLQSLTSLFLGFASLKDARILNLSERGAEYKLAQFYLERCSNSSLYCREKERVVFTLQSEIPALLAKTELCEWGFAFLRLLEKWKAQVALENIADHILFQIERNQETTSLLLCDAIRAEFSDHPFYSLLLEKMTARASNQVQIGDTEALFMTYECLNVLSPANAPFLSQLVTQAKDAIHRTIYRDEDNLVQTQKFLQFWTHVEKDPSRRMHFAQSLIGQGEMLWKKEGQESKGTRLMDIALSIVEENDRHYLNRHIEQFLSTLYYEAEQANMVKRLSMVYDALNHFNVGGKKLASPSSLANHLADAEYLFRIHNYASAQTHAEWILKFEPTNEQALKLLGLASFHLGEYKRALCALKQLPYPDETSRKALILSKAFSSQPQEDHLAQIDMEPEL